MRLRTLARKSADAVLAPFITLGHLHLGEEISQMQHALQCAWFAQQDGAPSHLVVAALLHDVGHLVYYQNFGHQPEDRGENGYHEKVGAAFLAQYFDDDIVKPVRLHVAAKRYQISTQPDYRQRLSAASWQSLQLQGGLMDDSTCRAFESSPWFSDALLLRKYDELGKQLKMAECYVSTINLDTFYELLVQHSRVMKTAVVEKCASQHEQIIL